jgi:hypothetical protein
MVMSLSGWRARSWFNRNADRPYASATLHMALAELPAGSASATAQAARSTSSAPTGSGTPGPPACSTPASPFTSSSGISGICRPQ